MGRKTAAEAEQTRRALIEAGIALFAERGYSGLALEDLMKTLGITRGALYHHFKNKRSFFFAVVERVQQDLSEKILKISAGHGDGWAGIEAGCGAFLRAAVDPTYRQIVIVDGPAALGWKEWKQLDDRYLTHSLIVGFKELQAQEDLQNQDPEALAVGLSGAMNEMAMWVAHHPRPKSALKRAQTTIGGLLRSARVRSGTS